MTADGSDEVVGFHIKAGVIRPPWGPLPRPVLPNGAMAAFRSVMGLCDLWAVPPDRGPSLWGAQEVQGGWDGRSRMRNGGQEREGQR